MRRNVVARLRSSGRPYADVPSNLTSQVFRCQFLQRLEHGFRLVDLSGADEIQHDEADVRKSSWAYL